MMKKIVYLILFFCILAISVSACGNRSVTSSSGNPATIQKPQSGKATVTGKVISTISNKPLATIVWLAEVTRQGDQGAYVLNAASSPSIYANANGVFVLTNVAPREYVIIVGNPESQNEVIKDSSGKPKVWNIVADQVIDTGELRVALTK
jgi:hypothetical protein